MGTVSVTSRGGNPSTSQTIFNSNITFGLPSSGSIGNNGALTGITSLVATYSEGLYLYFPANSIAAGVAAGLYWTVMSSGTEGTIYNNTYTSGQPAAPSSPTAFATTGPGAYTQTTASNITMHTYSVPGNTIWPNGSMKAEIITQCNNTANTKSAILYYGSSGTVISATLTSSTGGNFYGVLTSKTSGKFARNISSAYGGHGITTNFGITSMDFTAAQNITTACNIATATDFVLIHGVLSEVIK